MCKFKAFYPVYMQSSSSFLSPFSFPLLNLHYLSFSQWPFPLYPPLANRFRIYTSSEKKLYPVRRTHPITIGSSFLNYNFHLLQWKQQQREVVVYKPVDRSLVAETHLVDELDPGEDVPDAYYYVDALAGSHPLNKLDNFLPNLFPAIKPWPFSGSCFYKLFL